MLDNARIENVAKRAAKVAYTVLGLDCPYSISLIDDPNVDEDARLDTQGNVIQINLAKLEPFPAEAIVGAPENMSEEDQRVDEDYRHIMKVCSLVFHEMRHLYQKQAVTAYTINKTLGGKSVQQPESDKKCELWLSEMQAPGPDQDIEEDANDFAYYLTNRYPINLPMLRTNRRLGVMKRKYDKVEIPDV